MNELRIGESCEGLGEEVYGEEGGNGVVVLSSAFVAFFHFEKALGGDLEYALSRNREVDRDGRGGRGGERRRGGRG